MFKLTPAQAQVIAFMEEMSTLIHVEDIASGRFRRAVINKMVAQGILEREDDADGDAIWSMTAKFARWREAENQRAEAVVAAPAQQSAAGSDQNQPHLESSPHGSVRQVPCALVRAGDNDRKHFDQRALQELADSIAQHGLAQPITVRPVDGGYQIVAGERRFRAISQVLGWETVPAIVRELTDEEAAAVMLVENTARVDLDPIAEARAYKVRLERFGWSEQQIGRTAGVSTERVKNRLALLTIPEDLQHFVKIGQFPTGHALEIVDLDKDRQRIAVRAFNSAKSMPLPRFREIVEQLRADMIAESQMDMFALELKVMEGIDSDQFALRGRRARTGAPVKADLPAVKVAQTDTTGDILDRYVQDLQRAGLEDAAAVIGTIYTALVAVNCAAVPVNSALAKTADPADVAEAVVRIEKI